MVEFNRITLLLFLIDKTTYYYCLVKLFMEKSTFEEAIKILSTLSFHCSQPPEYHTNLPITNISKNIKSFEKYLELDTLYDENIIIKCVETFVLEYIIELCSDKSNDLEDALKLLLDNPHSELIAEITKRLNSYVRSTLCNVFSVHELNYLSLKNYESAACKGYFAILPEYKTVDLTVDFTSIGANNDILLTTPLTENSLNLFRKSLELTNSNNYLVCQKIEGKKDDDKIVLKGLATQKSIAEFPSITIHNKMWWSLSAYGNKLESKNGMYCLEKETELDSVIEKLLLRFNTLNSDDVSNLLKNIQEKAHGGLLIFTDNCDHINDLCCKKRGILINKSTPIKLEKSNIDILTNLCKIDGALIFDSSSFELVSIGTILDGVATVDGDLGRGSRYNSSLTFVNWLAKEFGCNVCAVVVSEDGYANMICPTVKRC